ncbi:MAG TPA: glutathione S-transferase N-terminal domain-containing protein [Novosphingobium sp.]|nr:glutathione S-transferase N-terminal domain-containing protein [Novosphingobium sp.]
MALELYFAPGSCAFAPLVLLEEAGAEFTAHRLVLANGDQRRPDFLAINPLGRVPALVVDGTIVTEAIAVMSFIASRFPEAHLLPTGDPVALGKCYEMMAWLATNQQVYIAQLWRTDRFVDEPTAVAALKEAALERLKAGFQQIEERIAGPWAMGESYSAVDPYLGVFRRWAERLELDTGQWPAWSAQHRRLLDRPATQAALAREAAPAAD